MVAARTLIPLAVGAIALGAVTGAIALGLRDPAPAPPVRPPVVDVDDPAPPPTVPIEPSPDGGADDTPQTPAAGLTQRLDDPDPDVRYELALELLRKGPAALAQARALRPVTPEGSDLQGRLVAAIDKMRLVRRATDYAKLPEHIRLRLDLDAFASVVPEQLLVNRRIAYWRGELAAVRHRLELGYAHAAEESVALLELALARREAGELEDTAYGDDARRLLPAIDAWIVEQKASGDSVPAQIRELETQVSRLRP